MNNNQNKQKPNLSLIGLAQAVGILAYCGAVGAFMRFMSKIFPRDPEHLGIVFMLFLLVFSAAINGAMMFGYPVYLVLNKKVKEALELFAFTLLYCFGFLLIIVVVMFVISK